MIDYCYLIPESMGNLRTIDSSCGLDPDFTEVHSEQDTSFHLTGCGLEPEECTVNPCCSEII